MAASVKVGDPAARSGGTARMTLAARALACLTDRGEAWWASRLLGFGRGRRSSYAVRYDDELGAVELAVSSGLVPDSWVSGEASARWRCERCLGVGLSIDGGSSRERTCSACRGRGHVTSPPRDGLGVGTLASLVAFAATDGAASLLDAADEVAPLAGLPPVTLRARHAADLSAEHAARCSAEGGPPPCMFAEAFVAGAWDAAPGGAGPEDVEWRFAVASNSRGAHVTAFSSSLFELSFGVPFDARFLDGAAK